MSGEILGAGDVGRRSPPAAWEAFFLIGIFPADRALRWCKVGLFSGGREEGRHCISSVEGMDGNGSVVTLLGRADGIERYARSLLPGELRVAEDGWHLGAPGAAWDGAGRELELALESPRASARTTSVDRIGWIRLPRVLTYWSAFGPFAWRAEGLLERGLGVVEHAWGAASRFDLARIGRAWHWDVLAMDDGAFSAGLALEALGGLRGMHGGGRLGAGGMERVSGMRVRVDAWDRADGRRVPARWRGTMRLGREVLRYEARASTPVAPEVESGGFLGFTFEGEARADGGGGRSLRGTGFCEYRARQP